MTRAIGPVIHDRVARVAGGDVVCLPDMVLLASPIIDKLAAECNAALHAPSRIDVRDCSGIVEIAGSGIELRCHRTSLEADFGRLDETVSSRTSPQDGLGNRIHPSLENDWCLET